LRIFYNHGSDRQGDKKKPAEELTGHGKTHTPGYTFWPFTCSYGIQCISILLTTNAGRMQIIKITAGPTDSKWDLFKMQKPQQEHKKYATVKSNKGITSGS